MSNLVRRYVRSPLFLSSLQVATSVVSYFVLIRVVIWFYSIEHVGLLAIAVTPALFVRMLDIVPGTTLNRVIALYNGDDAAQARLLDTTILTSIAFYCIGFLVAIVPAFQYFERTLSPEFSTHAKLLFPLAISSMMLTSINVSLSNTLDALDSSLTRSFIQISANTLLLILGVVLIRYIGICGYYVAQIIQLLFGITLARIVLCAKMRNLPRIPLGFDLMLLRKHLPLSIRLQYALSGSIAFDSIARIVLARYGGPAIVAKFDIAFKIGVYSRAILQSAMLPLIPIFARHDPKDSAQLSRFRHMRTRIWQINVLMYLAMILSAPALAYFFFGSFDTQFIGLLVVSGVTFLLAGIGLPYHSFAQAQGMVRWIFVGQWAGPVISVIVIGLLSAHLKVANAQYILFASYAYGILVSTMGNYSYFRSLYNTELENSELGQR